MTTLLQHRVLLAIREHGSMTQAAHHLHYGVPTVVHHLRALEAELQVQLVERDRTGTQLTPLGRAFADEVEPLIERVENAERMIRDQREAGVGTLRIGTFASSGSRLLPPAIAQLKQRVPLRVEVVEAEPTAVVGMLRSGEVHAGLIYDFSLDPAFSAPDLVHTPISREPYRVMLSRDNPLAAEAQLDFADLAHVSWVLSRNTNEAADRVLRRVCASVGYELRELIRTDDLYMIHGLVGADLGFALVTQSSVDQSYAVVLKSVAQNIGERSVSFVTSGADAPRVAIWLGEILSGNAPTART